MKKKKIETGKVVGTHGVRGCVRVQPWCDSPEFLCKFKKLFIKENGELKALKILSVKPHGNIVIMEIEGIISIDMAEGLRGKILYVDREDLNLDPETYLITDLLGCSVFDTDTGNLIGKITDVSKTGANDVWHIEKEGNEYLIPAIPDVVINVDIDKETVIIKPLDGIFD